MPWRRMVAEFTAVLTGVLLALFADATWDARQDRLAERQYLASIHSEFIENGVSIDELLAFHRGTQAGLGRLLTVIDSPEAFVSSDSVNAWVLSLAAADAFQPVMATYDDLVNSGRLGLIRSDSLRAGLARFEREVERTTYQEQWLFEFSQNQAFPFLTTETVLRDIFASRGGAMSESRFDTDFQRLMSSPSFENLVVLRQGIGNVSIVQLESLRETVLLIVRLSEASLDRS